MFVIGEITKYCLRLFCPCPFIWLFWPVLWRCLDTCIQWCWGCLTFGDLHWKQNCQLRQSYYEIKNKKNKKESIVWKEKLAYLWYCCCCWHLCSRLQFMQRKLWKNNQLANLVPVNINRHPLDVYTRFPCQQCILYLLTQFKKKPNLIIFFKRLNFSGSSEGIMLAVFYSVNIAFVFVANLLCLL